MFRPVEDRVVVRLEKSDAEMVTDAGIILPNNRKQIVVRGVVLQVGPDVRRVKAGDSVLMVHVVGVKCGLPELDDLPELKDCNILKETEFLCVEPAEEASERRQEREAAQQERRDNIHRARGEQKSGPKLITGSH